MSHIDGRLDYCVDVLLERARTDVDQENQTVNAERETGSLQPWETLNQPRTGRRRNRLYILRRLLLTADAFAISLALSQAVLMSERLIGLDQFLLMLPTLVCWVLIFKIYGLYDRDGKRISHSTVDEIPWIFHALVVGSLGLWAYTKFLVGERLDLAGGAAFFVTAFVAMIFFRAGARILAGRVSPPDRTLVVGSDGLAEVLVKKIQVHPEYGMELIGFADEESQDTVLADLPRLGHVADVTAICAREDVKRLIIASTSIRESTLADIVRAAQSLEMRLSILPHVVDSLGPSVAIDDIEGITVLGVNPPILTRSSRALKRSLDLVIAVPLLLLLLPLLFALAIAVRFDSKGPVFFRQVRVGRSGRRFRICKFRTMVQNAAALDSELRELSSHPAWLLLEDDPRVTRVGRLLRRASLDELPQLWNVIRGEMSLVGPRPMPPGVDERILGWGRRRLDLTPGITGLWQVLGRTSLPFEEMVKLDYLYVTNWSLWQDLRLLIHTLPAVISRRGAN